MCVCVCVCVCVSGYAQCYLSVSCAVYLYVQVLAVGNRPFHVHIFQSAPAARRFKGAQMFCSDTWRSTVSCSKQVHVNKNNRMNKKSEWEKQRKQPWTFHLCLRVWEGCNNHFSLYRFIYLLFKYQINESLCVFVLWMDVSFHRVPLIIDLNQPW